MIANEKPWATVRIAKDKMQEKIDEHRAKVFVTCDEECWCWYAQDLVTACEYRDAWDRQAGIGWKPEEFTADDARHALTGE